MPESQSHIIIQTGFIGDIALTMFLLEEMKLICPKDRIIFITTPSGAEIARAYPHIIDEVIVYDKRGKHSGWKGIRLMIATMRSYSADTLISLHQSFRTSLIVAGSQIPIRSGYNSSALSFVYTNRQPYTKGIHEVERQKVFLSMYKKSESTDSQKRRSLLAGSSKVRTHTEISEPYIVIAPGSVWPTKRWPKHHFGKLIESLLESSPHSIALIGSEYDASLCDSILPEQYANRVINLAGKLSLDETIDMISRARLLIANDSAPIHLASLVNCPTIAIFGPTHPAFGFAPLSDVSFIMQKNLDCRPCSIHGQAQCPLNTHACMEQTLPEEVLRVALNYLS
ncbi:MAG: glycosyltransferase family 9 protein [Candidatus Kapaibacteriota bacterium]